MTPLQILDRLAFCIGYVVIGAALLGVCVGLALLLFDLAVLFLAASIGRDNERMDD